MGKSQRTKGAAGERELARVLTKLTGRPWQRTAGQYRSGSDLPDVEPVGDSCSPLFVECKRGKRTSPKAALKQAIEAGGELPVACTRDDREEWLITCRLSDFEAVGREMMRKHLGTVTAGETVPGRVYVHPSLTGPLFRVTLTREYDFTDDDELLFFDMTGGPEWFLRGETGFLEVLTNTGENGKPGEGE